MAVAQDYESSGPRIGGGKRIFCVSGPGAIVKRYATLRLWLSIVARVPVLFRWIAAEYGAENETGRDWVEEKRRRRKEAQSSASNTTLSQLYVIPSPGYISIFIVATGILLLL